MGNTTTVAPQPVPEIEVLSKKLEKVNLTTGLASAGFLLPVSQKQEILKEQHTETEITCLICSNTKNLVEFFFIDGCKHPPVCRECHSNFLSLKLTALGVKDDIKCCVCKEVPYTHDEVQYLVLPELFDKYDMARRNNALMSMDGWMWCTNPKCTDGFIASKDENIITCGSCKQKSCSVCNCKWHPDLTCAAYQEKIAKDENDNEKKYKAWLATHTKKCPNCKMDIEKMMDVSI